jgi:hypothetical protein
LILHILVDFNNTYTNGHFLCSPTSLSVGPLIVDLFPLIFWEILWEIEEFSE